MLDREKGIVQDIIYEDTDYQELNVIIDQQKFKAMNYICLAGRCKVNDEVLLNTTAIKLSLGTGGYHFVIANLCGNNEINEKKGHIMKLRYTPLQIAVQTMEEQKSPFHYNIKGFKSLAGMPVISCSLHSMLAPAVAMIKYNRPDIRITYIMSDGASLPISISKAVRDLKRKKLIDNTITYGHAFGGDYEAINIYTALIGAKEVAKADIAIVSMGPGIVGTGTEYGFTGVEQGTIIDAINTLGGYSIAIPRINFSDKRERHYGISHHSITTFTKITKTPTIITIAEIENKEKIKIINEQIRRNRLSDIHNIQYRRLDELEKVLEYFDIKVSTMGRKYLQEKEFFQSAAASGIVALENIERDGDIN